MPLERVKAPVRQHNAPLYDWDELAQEDRVHRLIYTDPAVFDIEMTHIFGGTWVYLAHESQIPIPNDFITGKLGLRPLLITAMGGRDPRALQPLQPSWHHDLPLGEGQQPLVHCPYHGWNFAQHRQAASGAVAGRLCQRLVRDDKYNLAQVPRVDSYRGFVFGTLNLAAPPLLRASRPDQEADRRMAGPQSRRQGDVCEANRLKYKGNWKLAYDNSGDGYHVASRTAR